MSWLAELPVTQLSAAAVLALAVILILTGRLVPRSQLRELAKIRDEEARRLLAELDQWRRAHETAQQATLALAGQVQDLLEMSKATGAALASLEKLMTDLGRRWD